MYQSADYVDFLFHAVAVAFYRVTRNLCEVEVVQKFFEALFVCGRAVNRAHKVDVFQPRQLVVDNMTVRNVTHALFRRNGVGFEVVSVDDDAAFVEVQNAREALDSSGFSGAVRSDKSENFARFYLERNVVNRLFDGAAICF